MDYKKIYSDFIKNRRTLEAGISGYSEVHHIVPRSYGGSDSPENLIRLTAHDHYFAHCCLAKIHGGKMWFALSAIAMIATRRGRPYSKRKMIESAKLNGVVLRTALIAQMRKDGRLVQVGKKGADNGNHNSELYDWVNLDTGMERQATIHAMWREFGGSRPKWTQCQTGAYKTCFGWTIKGRDIRIRGMKGKSLDVRSPSGEVFKVSQKELCELSGMSIACASRLFRGNQKKSFGWELA